MYALGLVINPPTLTIKRLIAATPKTINRIPAAFLILFLPYMTLIWSVDTQVCASRLHN